MVKLPWIEIMEQKETDDSWIFKVEIMKSFYKVKLSKDYYEELTGEEVEPKKLIIQSFRFLLRREPKSSILKEFELPVIQEYFSEYEETMKRQLSGNKS